MIKIFEGDITSLQLEEGAIVNAANEMLFHGGGVARAIANACGKTLIDESRDIIRKKGRLKTAEAVFTSAGKLKEKGIKYVIHVVGPRGTDEKLLEESIKNVFELAKKLKVKTIALPAVSCGIFGFDKKLGSEIIFNAAKNYEKDFKEIYLVSIDNDIIGYWRELAGVFEDD